MIRSGCAAFPVAHSTYFQFLDTLEAGSMAALPRPETAARWRAEAPRGFVFSVVCDRGLTGSHFRKGREGEAAWEKTLAVSRALEASFVVLETPATFYPQADHLRDLYAFAKTAPRPGDAVLAWQPSKGWQPDLIRRVCRDLRLLHAVDPLAQEPVLGAVQYFRLRGGGPGRKPSRGHRYTDAELRQVAELARDKPTYAYFGTAEMWNDSRRLAKLAHPMPEPGRGRVRF